MNETIRPPELPGGRQDEQIPDPQPGAIGSGFALSPLHALTITMVSIFLAELVAMFVVGFFEGVDYVVLSFLDALIMVIIIFPVLYFLSFRPLLTLLHQRELALAELLLLQRELEGRVEARTAELNAANQNLELEIAERKQAEELLRYQATLLENISDAIIATDLDFKITSWNTAAEALYGWTEGEVIGRSTMEILETAYEQEHYDSVLQQFMHSGAWKGEVTQKNKAGARLNILASVAFVQDAGGTPVGAVSVNRDITDRKQAERAFEMLARFPSENPNPVLRIDKDGRILYANSASDELLNWWECQQGDKLGGDMLESALAALKDGMPRDQDMSIGDCDFTMTFTPVQDGGYVNIYGRDITARKRAEEELRLSEDRFSKAFQASPAAMSITRLSDGQFVDVNQAFLDIFGYTRAEALTLTAIDLYAEPDERGKYIQRLVEQNSATHNEANVYTKTGELISVLFSSEIIILEGAAHVLAILYDITARKRIEAALRESETRLRLAYEAAALGVWQYDPVTGGISSDERALQQFAIERENLNMDTIYERVHPEDLPRLKEEISTVLSLDGSERYTTEYRILHPGGEQRWISLQAMLKFDGEGEARRLRQVIGVSQDITGRKRSEQAILQAKLEWERTFDAVPDLVAIFDDDFNIVRLNQAMANALSSSPTDCIGLKCYETINGSSCAQLSCPHLLTSQDGQTHVGEIENLRLGGNFLVSSTPLFDGQGSLTGSVYVARDISERKRSELALRQAHDQLDLRVQQRTEELAQANLALALSNQELLALSRVEQELREFAESLAQSTIVLNSSLELGQVLVTILEQIRRVIPFTAADIILKEAASFRIAGHLNFRDQAGEWPAADATFALDDYPLHQQIFSTLQPLLIDDVIQVENWHRLQGQGWVRSYLGAPLVASGQVFGMIDLLSDRPGAFDCTILERLMAYTAPAAAAMQNAWLFARVRAGSEHLQALTRRLVEAQEGERRHIATELHDEVGQALTGLTLGLQLVEKKAGDPQAVRAELAEMNRMVECVLEDLHRLAMDLRPASLDHLGLAAALRQHILMIEEKFGLVVQLEMIGIQDRLPAEMETALYRIVQEAMNNVVRHSHARRVDVILEEGNGRLLLIIEDDGIGFDPQAALQNHDRLGLFGMRERAEGLGGKLTIESTAGKGAMLQVEVPYVNPHPARR